MITESKVIGAIQDISYYINVKENLYLFTKVANAVESGTINLDNLKSEYRNRQFTNQDVRAFFDVFLVTENVKTLYLIKGLEIIMSDKKISDFSNFEIEYVNNLGRTIEDNGVKEVFLKVLRCANVFKRYREIKSH